MGDIRACVGTASVAPHIQQFTISGTDLTGDMAASAPDNFEISLDPAGNYSKGFIIPRTGNTANAIIYVRSAATAPARYIFGNVTIISPGALNRNALVTGLISPIPTVNKPPDQSLAHGAMTQPVFFTGTGQDYQWTNNNPSIGLPANGRGNIPAFRAVNNTGVVQTATITVTPVPPSIAYVANGGGNTVSVVNTVTGDVLQDIVVGQNPLRTIVSPDGSRVYVVNFRGNSISTIDALTNKVLRTDAVPQSPVDIEISPDGKFIYVASSGSNRMTVFNTETFTPIPNFSIAANPFVIIKSPDGSRIYSASDAPLGGVTVVNTANNSTQTIPLPQAPGDIAITPNGAFLYISDKAANRVNVIRTASNTVLPAIAVGGFPTSVAMHPDGSKLYVANTTSNSVSVISTATNTVMNTIPVNAAVGITISPDGSTLYAVGRPQDISVISTASNTVATTIPLMGNLDLPVLSPDGSRLFVTDRTTQSAYIINTLTNRIDDVKPVGSNPFLYSNSVSSGTGCSGAPITFTIMVQPVPPPIITFTGTPAMQITTYGAASAGTSIQVSGQRLSSGILVTPPAGYEVSPDNTTFGPSLTVGSSGTLAATTLYIRLAATNNASANYGGNLVLSSGPTTVSIALPTGRVDPAPYELTVDDISKTYGETITNFTGNSRHTLTGGSLKNGNTITSVTVTYGTGSARTADVNIYSGSADIKLADIVGGNGYLASNYVPVIRPGKITVTPAELIIKADDIPKNYGSRLTVHTNVKNFKATGLQNGETIDGITITYTGPGKEANAPVGQYKDGAVPSSPTGGTYKPSNYALKTPLIPGDIIVNPAPLTITADNKIREFGDQNPVFTYSFNGFVNAEDEAVLAKQPTLTTTAGPNSPGGTYPIKPDGAIGTNYAITYRDGVLTVKPALTPPGAVLKIANTFTPNDDGINDTWNLPVLASYPKCSVKIFDRRGTLLFDSIGYPTPWDGTYRGANLPTGVYYYIIDPKLDAKVLSGTITIIR
ncbi:hypothetical protein GCM10028827_08490 [Mucilaginibacter myungsuensis]